MEFFKRDKPFPKHFMTLYPLGDWHIGSKQSNIPFVKQIINEVKDDPAAYWCGMGDLMENAVLGSKSDIYTQIMSPSDQMDFIVELLEPIKDKGLFTIAGNHEARTMRIVGLRPEQYISKQLGVPYLGFSVGAVFQLSNCKTPNSFNCYFHHSWGGGYLKGSKVNASEKLQQVVRDPDAVFSGHTHITSRVQSTWYGFGRTQMIEKKTISYIIGSALAYDESYAEERGKPPASVEAIKVTFVGATSGRVENRKQIYELITPKGGK